MALLNPGAWPDTAWCSQAWQPDSWPEYGTALPPAPPPTMITGVFRKKKPKVKLNRQTLSALKDYLEWKLLA